MSYGVDSLLHGTDVRLFARRLLESTAPKRLLSLDATPELLAQLLDTAVTQVNAKQSVSHHSAVTLLQRRLCEDIAEQVGDSVRAGTQQRCV